MKKSIWVFLFVLVFLLASCGNPNESLKKALVDGKSSNVESALKKGADPNLIMDNGESALAYSILNYKEIGSKSMLKLLSAGADATTDEIVIATYNVMRSSKGSSFIVDGFEDLLDAGLNYNYLVDSEHNLFQAVIIGDMNRNAINYLCKRGVDPDTIIENDETALQYVIKHAHHDSVSTLVYCGADKDISIDGILVYNYVLDNYGAKTLNAFYTSMFPKIDIEEKEEVKASESDSSSLFSEVTSYYSATLSDVKDLYGSILGGETTSKTDSKSGTKIPSWAQGKWKGKYEGQDARVTISRDDVKISANNVTLSVSKLLETTANTYSVYGVDVTVENENVDEDTFEMQMMAGGVGTALLRIKNLGSKKISLELPTSGIFMELSK